MLALLLTLALVADAAAGEVAQPPQTETVAAPGPADETLARIRSAERLECRDEPLGAQMEYLAGLMATVTAARAGGEDAPYLWAQGAFLLTKLLALTAETGESEDWRVWIEATLAEADAPPLFLARVRWAGAQLALRRGEGEAAKTMLAPLKLIDSWLVVGPFDNEHGRSFGTAFGPEDAPPTLDASYPGKKRSVAWRTYAGDDPRGYVDLGALFRPRAETLAYALCLVKAEAPTPAALRVGSDDMIAAWINFRRTSPPPPEDRPPVVRRAQLDQNAAPIMLRRGWNALLLKIGQARDEWGFYARLTAPDGTPLTGLTFATDPAEVAEILPRIQAAADDEDAPAVDGGALSTLAAAVNAHPADHRACYYLGSLMLARRPMGRLIHAERQLLLRATRLAPHEGIYFLALAAAAEEPGRLQPDRDENLRRMALEKARDLDGSTVRATVMLAHYYLESMQNLHRADALLTEALTGNPQSPLAQLTQAELFRRRGWSAEAGALLAELLRRNPGQLAAYLLQARLSIEAGQSRRAYRTFAAAHRIDATSAEAALGTAETGIAVGETSAALAALDTLLTLHPTRRDVLLARIRLLRETGRIDAALAAIEQSLTLAPADHELLAEKGRCLLAQGHENQALETWQAALALEPGYAELKRRLAVRGIEDARPTTVIEDLAAYVRACADFAPPAGESHAYLLDETVNILHGDGTRRSYIHRVIRVASREGVERLRRIPIFYDAETEELSLRDARVLHADGRIDAARLIDYGQRGRRGIALLVFPALERGDTIEIEYRLEQYRQTFFGDYFGHIHLFRREAPIRLGRYVLVTPKGRDIHVHRTGGAPEAKTEEDAETVTRIWELTGLTATPDLPQLPLRVSLSPTVQVSTFADWQALNRWYWHLVRSQNLATPEIREKVEELTRGAAGKREQVAALFEWVTSEVRNNAWEFGVHGYKPYNAGAIFTRRFGDCKDKATLLNVMARELGLEAWPVLVRAVHPQDNNSGRSEEDLTLPLLSHFNHCISGIVVDGETLYLDPTLSYRTIDSRPFMNAGAEATIIRPDGGERIQLPPHDPERNRWDGTLAVSLDDEGRAEMTQTVTGTGQVAVFLRAWFKRRFNWDGALKHLATRHYGRIGATTVETVDVEAGPDAVAMSGRLLVPEYARSQGERMVLRVPTIFLRGEFGRSGALPESFSQYCPHSARDTELVLPTLFRVKRAISLKWPAGYRLRNALRDIDEEHPFGTLQVRFRDEGGVLTVDYDLRFTRLSIPPEDYPAFRRFCLLADRLEATDLFLEKSE